MAELGALQQFRYRAVDIATGRHRRGELAGEDAYAVRASLRRAGLEVEHIEAIEERSTWPGPLATLQQLFYRRQRQKRQMQRGDLLDGIGTLLKAGLPLEQALGSLSTMDSRSAAERKMLRRLRDNLRQGTALSQACMRHPDWFDRIDTALMEAGQRSGDLAEVLVALSAHHQRNAGLGHQLIMALAYPCLLMVIGIGVLAFISRTTLPQLAAVLSDSGKEVPVLTTWLIELGQVMTGQGHWLLAGGALLFWLLWMLWHKLPADRQPKRWLLRNPISRARSRSRVAQLASTLAHLQHNGLPLAEALQVVAETASSAELRNFLQEAGQAVRRGDDLSAIASRTPLLDPEFAQLLHLGEQSGELAQMLDGIGERFGRAAERSMQRLAAMLEPVAIIILAGLIGVVVIGAALPLVAMGDLL